MSKKIEKWHKNIHNYIKHIEPGDDNKLTDKELREMQVEPAYKRRNTSFSYKPTTQDTPIRHQLNETPSDY